MRRLIALGLLAAAFAVAAVAALASFTPHTGTYDGDSSAGHRVTFTTDTHHVHNFRLGHIDIFSNARIDKHTAGGHTRWSFRYHDRHFNAFGSWFSATTVHGSICKLNLSSDGCRRGTLGKQSYAAELKTPK